MSNIKVPSADVVDSKSQEIFNNIKSKLGMLPNLYATIGYSSDALASFLEFDGNAGKSSFSNKEIEAIKLAVSQVNECEYCLAAHTAIGKMNGFSLDETIQLRDGSITDSKLSAITALAREITLRRGHADFKYVQAFFDQGFDNKALIDLLSTVTAITFTNYVHGVTKVDVDFPRAVQLVSA